MAHIQDSRGKMNGARNGHGMTRRDFVTLAGLALSSLGLAACGKTESAPATTPAKEAQGSAATAAPSAVATTSPSSVDNTFRIVNDSNQLVSLDNQTFDPQTPGASGTDAADADAASTGRSKTSGSADSTTAPADGSGQLTLIGRFSEGKALVTWETSEYDEEWATSYDTRAHLGCVDGTGKLMFEFTEGLDDLPGLPISFTLDYNEHDLQPCYQDGFVAVTCKYDDGTNSYKRRNLAYDATGKLLFSNGEGGTYQKDASTGFEFRDGVFVIGGSIDNSLTTAPLTIVDTTGAVVCEQQNDGYMAFGPNMIAHRSRDLLMGKVGTKVLDYTGNALFDNATALSDECDEVDASLIGGGLLKVSATKKNPHEGGADKHYSGIYDVAKQAWAYGPIAQDLDAWGPFEDVLVVSIKKFEGSTDAYDADEIPFQGGAHGLMTVGGAFITGLGNDHFKDGEKWLPTHYADGYWAMNAYDENHHGKDMLVHIEGKKAQEVENFTWPGFEGFGPFGDQTKVTVSSNI